MITKRMLLDSMRAENRIIKHLATKVRPETLDWRPTERQRSLRELMRYMTRMAIVPAVQTVTGNWDHAEEMENEAEAVTPEGFAGEMDIQMARIEELFDGLDETEAGKAPATMPWGTPTTVAAGMMDMVLKCFVAYRMQLFLYVKQTGVHDIGPPQCWAGVDPPPLPAEG